MKYKLILLVVTVFGLSISLSCQSLPLEFNYSANGHKLIIGNTVTQGFYDETQIDTIYLQFYQTDYWALLAQNYAVSIDIPASLTHNGITYDSVGVRFKGNTSYTRLVNTDKYSFAISMDAYKDDRNIEGYESLNLNNAFQDESAMREILYLNAIRKHIPAAKGNYVQLFLNGQNWGIYPNVQALNKEHVGEWFLDNDATRWRCERTTAISGGGNRFNAGLSSLNYLGDSILDYSGHYDLKNSDKDDPWQDLIVACSLIDKTNSSATLDVLKDHFDVDQALWFLASENIFTDDDGYVFKGGMDYYAYFDVATNRLVPIEYDGNSCMAANKATNWTPFYNETDANFALMFILLKVPEIRQRYLAHYRTMLKTSFDTTTMLAQINNYSSLISQRYANDPKALSTSQEHLNEVDYLKQFVRDRSAFLFSNSEIQQQGIDISGVSHAVNGTQWGSPSYMDSVLVVAFTAAPSSIKEMNLYFGAGLAGRFNSISMFDDGNHGDGASGDGQFGAYLPAQAGGQSVRYYVESVANNSAESRVYEPAGAEHDVFIYNVTSNFITNSDIVINEFLASNSTSDQDQEGEFDDWIEIYNKGNSTVDISGYALSDDITDFTNFTFPSGTFINADSYVIVWADGDISQSGFHADFKLSAGGETLFFADSNGNILDTISFGSQNTDISFGRFPNGTGSFQVMPPTINSQNIVITSTAIGDLVINEFMASNTNTIADQDGEFDDWIELFNKGVNPINLSEYSLSDDDALLNQFTFPNNTTLLPDSFVIVWADEDTTQGGFHADFKLSSNGETLYLSDSNLIVVDSVLFGSQGSDVSYGRFPNGTGNFQTMMTPTFKGININIIGLSNINMEQVKLKIYPNPAQTSVSILIAPSLINERLSIYNIQGKLILNFELLGTTTNIDISSFNNGVYVVRLGNGITQRLFVTQ